MVNGDEGERGEGDGDVVLCKHCGLRKPNRTTRGLCNRCFDDKAVRGLYPVKALHYLHKGVGFEMAKSLRGWKPTTALPGTPEKVKVLMQRASMGYPLWHPQDAQKNVK
jgi:hypothetical protein